MGATDAVIARHTNRTADAVERLLAAQQRTNELLEQVLHALTPAARPQPAQEPTAPHWQH